MKITYKINTEIKPEKQNPQIKQIVEGLLESGKTEFDKVEIAEIMEKSLTTKQDPMLVFKFYQGRLINSGFLSVNREYSVFVPKVKAKKQKETVEV